MGINFKHKTFRHASELSPDELPPVVGKARLIRDWDKVVEGIPKQENEVDYDAERVPEQKPGK